MSSLFISILIVISLILLHHDDRPVVLVGRTGRADVQAGLLAIQVQHPLLPIPSTGHRCAVAVLRRNPPREHVPRAGVWAAAEDGGNFGRAKAPLR